MADKVQHHHSLTGMTLYFHIRIAAGTIWNGSSFEAYASGNWGTYDVSMTEQGASRVYLGAFPALAAGVYAVTAYEQTGGSPAETDTPIGGGSFGWTGTVFVDYSDIVSHGDANWGTIPVATVSAAVLATPANKLATDASGEVTVGEASEAELSATIASASRAEMDSGSTQLAAIVADTNELQADWANGGRLDVLIDAILADTAALQADWANGGRLDLLVDAIKSATDGLPDGERLDLIFDAIKVVTDRLSGMLEVDGGVYRFTSNALEEGPGAGMDATSANQAAILAAVSALNDPTAAAVASAVIGSAVDGTLTMAQALTRIAAAVSGKSVQTAADPLTLEFYKDDDLTVAFTLAIELDASGRVKS